MNREFKKLTYSEFKYKISLSSKHKRYIFFLLKIFEQNHEFAHI